MDYNNDNNIFYVINIIVVFQDPLLVEVTRRLK